MITTQSTFRSDARFDRSRRNPGRQSIGSAIAAPLASPSVAVNSPEATLPSGYRLVETDSHMITNRDMVFVGGSLSFWQPARRAGESGGLRKFSMVRAVAAPSFS